MRHESPLVRFTRAVVAVLILAALVSTLVASAGRPDFAYGNFFSYFTILSNILAALVLISLSIFPPVSDSPRSEWLRGAATAFMALTGVVYALLLSDISVGMTAAWANAALHRVSPVFLVLDWLIVRQTAKLSWRAALQWLLFPLSYLVYTEARGAISGWYPYPFLDTGEVGFGGLAVYVAGISVFFASLCALVVFTGRRRVQTRRGRDRALRT